jgi:two-component system KDP operon response regulator KdpE
MEQKVLLIDDDMGLLTLLKIGLEREGFVVTTAENGREGLRQAYRTHPDVIVLDVMMPEMDGWTTCQKLRQVCDVPIIMLTGKTSERDVIKGLSLGADDYLTKPCSFDELKTRIDARLRRRTPSSKTDWKIVYDDGHLRVDLRDGTVTRRGEMVDLSPTEMRLLAHLVRQKGRIVPRKELLISVWGPGYAQELGYLSVYIRYLRQKIEDNPSSPRYIQTRWRLGYLFAESRASLPVPRAAHAQALPV